MSKDARVVLDAVRTQADGADKILVLRVTPGGALVVSQANTTYIELLTMVDSFRAQVQQQIDLEKLSIKKGRIG